MNKFRALADDESLEHKNKLCTFQVKFDQRKGTGCTKQGQRSECSQLFNTPPSSLKCKHQAPENVWFGWGLPGLGSHRPASIRRGWRTPEAGSWACQVRGKQ